MKTGLLRYLIAVNMFIVGGCELDNNKSVTADSTKAKTIVENSLHAPNVQAVHQMQVEELPTGNLTEMLRSIRDNVKQINSTQRWTRIDKRQLSESTEGGEANYFILDHALQKITVQHFGETGKVVGEFYLLDGHLSFAIESAYEYNRPIYWDSALMMENADAEVFDFEKSRRQDKRSYFHKGKLIYQSKAPSSISTFDDGYLFAEQKKVLAVFESLILHRKK